MTPPVPDRSQRARRDAATPAVPWWRVGVLWLMLGGLGAVVIASVALLVVAVRHPDELSVPATTTAQTPAMLGRNHAATPAR